MNPETIQPTPEQADNEQDSPESPQLATSVTPPVVNDVPPGMKPKKTKLVILLILVVILLAGAYLFYEKNKTDTNNSANQTSSMQNGATEAIFDTPKNTIYAIETKVKELLDAQGVFNYGNLEDGKSTGTAYIQADTKDYFAEVTVPNDGTLSYFLQVKPGKNVGDTNERSKEEKAVLDDLKKFMEDSSFTYTNSGTFDGEVDSFTFYNYEKDNFQCSVGVDFLSVFAGCVEKTTAEKAKTDVAPFVKILKDNMVNGIQTVSPASIEDGKNGYKIATIWINPPQKHIILQKAGSTTWEYFGILSYQDGNDCSVFEKSTNAKLAFENYPCLEEGRTPSTVKSQ